MLKFLPLLLLILSPPCQAQSSGMASRPTSITRLDRLIRLADHLETIDPNRFGMKSWGTSTDPSSPSFVGCAAGHATYLFAADGFRLFRQSGGSITARYGDHYGIDACQSFFGLSHGEAAFVFGACDRTPWEEAAALRTFIGRRMAVAMVMR